MSSPTPNTPSPALSRRAVLRGLGVAVSLPFLEAMVPGTVLAAGTPEVRRRMAVCYFGTGMNMRQFEPEDEGEGFTYSPILEPLEPFRADTTVLSGTYLEHGGSHIGDYTFLTGASAHTPTGIQNGVSADQVAAAQIGTETRFPSLQLSISRGTGFGGNLKTLSWNRAGVPLAAESDPRAIFERLFGVAGPESRARRERSARRRQSVLDFAGAEAKRLEARVGRRDRDRLDQYFTSIREVEAQLERNVEWSERPKPEVAPATAARFASPYDPEATRAFHYETYAKLMYDLIALTFQTDSTRVITYVVRRENVGGVYPEFKATKDYHSLSHHGNDPRNLDELARIDTIYMRHWAYFLERLRSVKEGDVTLLDNCLVAFSSGMGIGHSKDRLPTALFGGGNLGVGHRGHLRLERPTPLSALWHTMLDRMGVSVPGSFQDSPGVLRELLA